MTHGRLVIASPNLELLTSYVMMVGEPDNMAYGWKLITSLVELDPPTDLGLHLPLGCNHHVGIATMHNRKVRTETNGVDAVLKSYCDMLVRCSRQYMSFVYVGNATADPRGSRRLPCRVPRATL